MTKSRYVVSWMQNERPCSESFEFLTLATFRMIQLETFGMKPYIMMESYDSTVESTGTIDQRSGRIQ